MHNHIENVRVGWLQRRQRLYARHQRYSYLWSFSNWTSHIVRTLYQRWSSNWLPVMPLHKSSSPATRSSSSCSWMSFPVRLLSSRKTWSTSPFASPGGTSSWWCWPWSVTLSSDHWRTRRCWPNYWEALSSLRDGLVTGFNTIVICKNLGRICWAFEPFFASPIATT